MKGILKMLGAMFVLALQKITGKSTETVVQLPEIQVSQDTINHVIDIVNNIKKVVTNPVTVFITDLIPGTLDNAIRAAIEAAIVPVLAGLTFSKSWLNTGTSNEVLLDDLLNKIHFADDADKNALYHALAARLIVVASDGKVTWSEAASVIELYFKNIFGAPKAA